MGQTHSSKNRKRARDLATSRKAGEPIKRHKVAVERSKKAKKKNSYRA